MATVAVHINGIAYLVRMQFSLKFRQRKKQNAIYLVGASPPPKSKNAILSGRSLPDKMASGPTPPPQKAEIQFHLVADAILSGPSMPSYLVRDPLLFMESSQVRDSMNF